MNLLSSMSNNRRALRIDDQLVPNVGMSQALATEDLGFLARFYTSRVDRTMDCRA